MSKYITTTLPYVNADPHLGHALEFVQADVIARFWRLTGNEVFFNTGTDEHGQKIAEKADQGGRDRQEYVDHYAEQFRALKGALNLSYDRFIRTTDPMHKEAAAAIWRECLAAGDIYKKKYSGLYCVGDEMFLRESDLVDGRCPNHPNLTPQVIEEENYFFALSKYADYLKEYLSQPGVIEPEWRRLEALNFVESGLEDFSISRERARLNWGIPVPDDKGQVMYVWFDALTNYISTLGWPTDSEGLFKKFWEGGQRIQLAGKDQIRFQSIIWQAMLKSAGLPATNTVVYHGFINSGGQKMSKSLGNVISPHTLIEKYGTEGTRFLLIHHTHPFEDSDFTPERLDEWYNAELANGLGNLVARIMKLAEAHLPQPITLSEQSFAPEYVATFEAYNLQAANDYIWRNISALDTYIADTKPFTVVKDNPEEARKIIGECVERLADIAYHLQPILPTTAETILNAIRDNKKPVNLFNRLA